MYGIAGIVNTNLGKYPDLEIHLSVMNKIQAHRGPDDDRVWTHPLSFMGFAHRRCHRAD